MMLTGNMLAKRLLLATMLGLALSLIMPPLIAVLFAVVALYLLLVLVG